MTYISSSYRSSRSSVLPPHMSILLMLLTSFQEWANQEPPQTNCAEFNETGLKMILKVYLSNSHLSFFENFLHKTGTRCLIRTRPSLQAKEANAMTRIRLSIEVDIPLFGREAPRRILSVDPMRSEGYYLAISSHLSRFYWDVMR